MAFKEATDSLFRRVGHEDLARALGVSVASIRQARLKPEAGAHRSPPEHWEDAVIRLAEDQAASYRQLVKTLKQEARSATASGDGHNHDKTKHATTEANRLK